MRSLFTLGLSLLATVMIVGCKNDSKTADRSMQGASMDACSHCAGVQTATASGKCPVCGMTVGTNRP